MGDTKNIGSIAIMITFRTKYRWYRLLEQYYLLLNYPNSIFVQHAYMPPLLGF